MKKLLIVLTLLAGVILPAHANAVVTYSCPTGSSLTTNNECLPDLPTTTPTSLSFTTTCPDGYTLNNNICTKPTQSYTATQQTTYSCPSGGSLSGSTCTIAGYQGASTSYNASLSTSNYCPNGGYLSGSYCITRDAVAGDWYQPTYTYSCPNGGTLSGSTCLKTTMTYTYSAGCIYSGSMYSCPANYNATATASSCNSGYYLYGGYCQKDAISQLSYSASVSYSYSCPSGGSLSGSTCTIAGAYIQPTSYSATGSTTLSCPTGGTLSNGLCTGVTTVQSVTTYSGICPSHYTINEVTGYCQAQVFQAIASTQNTKYSCYAVYGGATWISPYDNTSEGYVYCSINTAIAQSAEGDYYCQAYDLTNYSVTAYVTNVDDSTYEEGKKAVVCDFRPYTDYQQTSPLENVNPSTFTTPCDALNNFNAYYTCVANQYV